ncbi:MAG: histidine kinase [Gammaproteobacteria bacterium]|nr:histidine kinase [Gammaproteobacteria bacterium]
MAQHFHECKRLRETNSPATEVARQGLPKRRIFATLPLMSRAIKYAGAIAIATAAIALRWLLIPWLGSDVPYATLIGAIAIAVWMGGWGPALAAAVFGFVGTAFVIGRPLGSLPVDRNHTIVGVTLYAVTCLLIIVLGEAMRRARDAYRRSQERFLRSQEVAIQGYALLKTRRDRAGKIVDFDFEYINPLGAAIGRSEPERVVGRPLTTVMPGSCAAGLLEAASEVIKTGAPADIELADSSVSPAAWIRYLIVKVEDGIALSFSDITQTKQLALELKQRAADLQRTNVIKSLFLATLSHELRNPLAPLRYGLAILKTRMPDDVGDVQAMMERQVRMATRLIDDLLDAARIDRGKLELHRERVAIDSVISAGIETARPNIEGRSHELLVRHAPRPLYVDGDSIRLVQVIANLLNNAAKFTPPKGRIEIWVRAKAEHVIIRVRDNGLGIAHADLASIFDMFVQLGSSETHSVAGLGLGLALARSLITLHGGEITAHSAGLRKGSEFRIRLPLADTPADSSDEPETVRPAHTARRILVVDDNVDAATSLTTLLEYKGHSVRTCFDGATAFEVATHSPPEIAFIDLNMPDLDGVELARMIRRQPWGENVKLIALTGMGQPADVERTRAADFDQHMTKPADPDELFRAIATPRRVAPLTEARVGDDLAIAERLS